MKINFGMPKGVKLNTNQQMNSKFAKFSTLISTLICILVAFIGEFFLMIPISYKSPGFIMLLIVLMIIWISEKKLLSGDPNEKNPIAFGILIVLVIYLVIGNVTGMEFFNAKKYRDQLNMDETADFFDDNEQIGFKSIPVVDRESARVLGDRKMGEIRDYVSQFSVSEDYVQVNYQGTPIRVTPLEYADAIKWFNNHKDGLPAYIRVNMVSQEATVVRLEEKQMYSETDWFLRNIYRHLFVNYPTLLFDELQFEINEEGQPYYIAPVYEYKIGLFGGRDIVGAVLVNACNGEHQYYEIDSVPTWVDRVYPEDLVLTQLENWGNYVNGFVNSVLGQRSVLAPTDGYNYVAINDDVHLYTGLTSVGNDESNVGFALINLRTKEAKFYNIPGAEEYSAMESAQGQVQDLHYRATFPILINSGGEPTYFMSLKDGANLVKQYAFVSVRNYSIVATGTTVSEAQKKYYQALKQAGNKVEATGDEISLEGVVDRISATVVDNNSRYYFSIEGDSRVFIAPISLSDHLPLVRSGDTVKFTFVDSKDEVIIINTIEKGK